RLCRHEVPASRQPASPHRYGWLRSGQYLRRVGRVTNARDQLRDQFVGAFLVRDHSDSVANAPAFRRAVVVYDVDAVAVLDIVAQALKCVCPLLVSGIGGSDLVRERQDPRHDALNGEPFPRANDDGLELEAAVQLAPDLLRQLRPAEPTPAALPGTCRLRQKSLEVLLGKRASAGSLSHSPEEADGQIAVLLVLFCGRDALVCGESSRLLQRRANRKRGDLTLAVGSRRSNR